MTIHGQKKKKKKLKKKKNGSDFFKNNLVKSSHPRRSPTTPSNSLTLSNSLNNITSVTLAAAGTTGAVGAVAATATMTTGTGRRRLRSSSTPTSSLPSSRPANEQPVIPHSRTAEALSGAATADDVVSDATTSATENATVPQIETETFHIPYNYRRNPHQLQLKRRARKELLKTLLSDTQPKRKQKMKRHKRGSKFRSSRKKYDALETEEIYRDVKCEVCLDSFTCREIPENGNLSSDEEESYFDLEVITPEEEEVPVAVGGGAGAARPLPGDDAENEDATVADACAAVAATAETQEGVVSETTIPPTESPTTTTRRKKQLRFLSTHPGHPLQVRAYRRSNAISTTSSAAGPDLRENNASTLPNDIDHSATAAIFHGGVVCDDCYQDMMTHAFHTCPFCRQGVVDSRYPESILAQTINLFSRRFSGEDIPLVDRLLYIQT